jgi:SAM-dependent methyltransferase
LMVGDGERLPFSNASFNVVIVESAFSLFPNQKDAAKEIIRVLKPGGKLVLSDVTLRGQVSEKLQSRISFPCCMAGAKRLEEYVGLFEQAGFHLYYLEDRSRELQEIGFRLGMAFGGLDNITNKLPSGPCQRKRKEVSMNIVGAWSEFLRMGRPGYVLMAMIKI